MFLSVVFVDPFIKHLLFADDLKICCIKNVEDCKVLQCNIDSMQRCLRSGVKQNIPTNVVI